MTTSLKEEEAANSSFLVLIQIQLVVIRKVIAYLLHHVLYTNQKHSLKVQNGAELKIRCKE